MSNSLRLLTYNVQCKGLLPSLIEQVNPIPLYNPEERAKEISNRILASPRDFDIIALQEVFDEGARDVFSELLKTKYPHAVTKPGADIGLLLGGIGTVLTGNPLYVAAGFLLGGGEFDDSGLMVFSRFPFLKRTIGSGQYAREVPEVGFIPYDEATASDDWAEKGAVYVRFDGPDHRPIHVLATHTQADYENAGEHAAIRRAQFIQLWNLGFKMSGLTAMQGEEVFIVGDFNIVGGSAEWTQWIDNPFGSTFTDWMRDAWVHEQCPGSQTKPALAATDPGYTAPPDRGGPPQRLDYVVRNKNTQLTDRLAAQHLAVAYDLVAGAVYLSDHLPLCIDLNLRRTHCTVDTALLLAPSLADPTVQHDGVLMDGQMDWFVIAESGAYDIRLDSTGGRAAFEVFTGTNLSVPMQPYTTVVNDYGRRFVLPEAPFFIRVFIPARRTETSYRLRVHRPAGRDMGEAIDLPPAISTDPVWRSSGQMTSTMIFSADRLGTPFSEHDCVWFRIRCEASDSGEPQDIQAVVRDANGEEFAQPAFGLQLLSPDAAERIADAPADTGAPRLSARIERPGEYFLLVQRRDLSVGHVFSVQWTTNLTVLCDVNARGGRGLPLRLRCAELSQGFPGTRLGSDEINVNVWVDGKHVRHAPYEELGGFAKTTIRDLAQWLAPVRFVRELKIELVELDDLSEADRGSRTIGPLGDAYAAPGWATFVLPGGGALAGELKLEVAGGTYYLSATLAKSLLRAP